MVKKRSLNTDAMAARVAAHPDRDAARPYGPLDAPADLGGIDFRIETLPPAIEEAAMRSGGFPYDAKLSRKRYDTDMLALQIELQKLLKHLQARRERLVIVLEGRDGAGKGGTIGAFTRYLNPRHARIVALSKPTETEAGQWYFQRYASQMPTAGEIVFFDRSWYNRAMVEPVMGFCTPEQTAAFLKEAPAFEAMIARAGTRIIKLFLTIGPEMQIKRLHARYHDPLKRWKLSPIDFESIARFDAYSQAIEAMLEATDIPQSRWTVIRGNDKRRARLAAIRTVLNGVDYADRDEDLLRKVDRRIALSATAFLRRGGEEEIAEDEAGGD
jgi:polyphosphate kinase 2